MRQKQNAPGVGLAGQPQTRLFLRVQGIVQGVGFRPFVARLANRLDLAGFVENTSSGVEIEVEGPSEQLRRFVNALQREPPPMARLFEVEQRELPPDPAQPARVFAIRSSRVDPIASAVIPPDIATCPRCRAEVDDPTDRRAGYPFTNCTDCGPRYTLIRAIPYDRQRTSMSAFPMCPACAAEYADPGSRRFHAQPNACPECGPQLRVLDEAGRPLDAEPLEEACRTLSAGGVVALLGLGGFHLACDATNEGAVQRLRQRKRRPAKPFAVMVPDLERVRSFVRLDASGAGLLTSPQAPIVLLQTLPECDLALSVAPGQDRLGIFLPYTPLHHLLFRVGGYRALVMTSGNRSDEPILATEAEARDWLAGVADRFLVHDRAVVHRLDDSVAKDMGALGPVVLRRARGYAPLPISVPNPNNRVVLGLGAELASTVCVARGPHAFLGPHVGDLKSLETENVFRRSIDHLLALLRVEPECVVCDLHPGYRSSQQGQAWAERGVEVVRVQHHEAHAAACMAEHRFAEEAIVLALDGLGYGHDGTFWGGEILAGRPGTFRRLAHLKPVPQPGGDRAARQPWRMAASHLREAVGPRWLELSLSAFRDHPRGDLEVLQTAMERGINAPLTSSCGRLFDAAAAILGFRGPQLYSAQAPMELEAMAARTRGVRPYPSTVAPSQGGPLLLQPAELLRALLEDVTSGRDPGECALAFHLGLASLFVDGTRRIARATGLRHVFLTGGCVQNAVFLSALVQELDREGLPCHVHCEVPPNDGGISYGQVAWLLMQDKPHPLGTHTI